MVVARRFFSDLPKYKEYHEIPARKSFLPAILHLLWSGGPGYLHEYCDRMHSSLGSIFRERLGSIELVFIADTKMIQTVIAHEGSQPHHNVPEAWIHYNKVNKVERGIFFQTGEPWVKLRRVFNKVMLSDTSKINRFTEGILDINSDFLSNLSRKDMRDKIETDSKSFITEDIKFELCKWSIEATGLMLFGCRMGCIQREARKLDELKAEELVNNVANMFAETSNFQIIPCDLARRLNLGTWKRFKSASDNMLKLANEFVDKYMEEVKDSDSNQSLLKDLLELRSLDDDEISRSLVDLIIAAADTTSNSLQWMLHTLAKYPEIQTKILEEVEGIYTNLNSLQDIKQSCPYLAAFVKEVSRLYPTAPFLARSLDQTITLKNYTIPPKVPIVFSLYTTSRSQKYFKDPLDFKPDRWLRNGLKSKSADNRQTVNHAYASLPFGVGARMCLGRRLADLEIHLLIASFVLKYKISLCNSKDVQIKLKMILCPDQPIKLKLTPRARQSH